MTSLDLLKLTGLIALCIGVGFSSSLLGPSQTEWYRALTKPPGQPPDWAFGVVWTILYILMAVAAWLVWWQCWNHPGVKLALGLFSLQLLLNFLWSPAFFGLQSIVLGLVVIIPLWIAIGLTTLAFYRVHAAAGGLMVPYLLWVSYATYLNIALLVLNR